MKIGVVTTSYPRWPGDPAGSFVEGHVRALGVLGHDVHVVAAGDERELAYRTERARELPAILSRQERELATAREHRRDAERRGIPLPRIVVTRSTITFVERVMTRGLFYGGGAPDTIEKEPSRMFEAARFSAQLTVKVMLRAREWDQIVAHWLPCAIAALPARKPMTVIAHGGDVHLLKRLHLLPTAIRALRNAKRVYVSEQLRELANDRDGIVQPMGIDLAHFAKLGRAPTTPPTILFAGRLVPIKGVDTLIEAMPHVRARLVIAGDGPERRALEARALARRASITFLGEVDTKRRDQLLREASCVVVPSRTLANGRTEGCPTIALEALAAGVPVVATIGRANEIVAPDDPIALARAIDRMLAAPLKTQPLVTDLDWRAVAGRLLRT